MRTRFLVIGAVVFAAVAIIAGYGRPTVAATGSIPVDCDRACLEGLATQYLAAVVAHNPKSLPLAADVKYTENDQVMDVGDGFWGTATAVGSYKHCFSDPVVEQIGCMVTMHEGDHIVIMGLRLRVELGRITEIETTYYRQGGGGPSMQRAWTRASPKRCGLIPCRRPSASPESS
jgi:hypothetical protein